MSKEHEKKERLISAIPAVALLCLLMIGIYELVFASGESSFSAHENRMLADCPVVSWKTVFDGSFEDQLERFLADHFPARNKIIDYTQDLRQAGSLATWDDYARIAKSEVAVMDFCDETEPDAVAVVTPRPTRMPTPTPKPAQSAEAGTTPLPSDITEQESSATPVFTNSPRPTKPPRDPESFPAVLKLYLLDGNKETAALSMMRTDLMAWAQLLDAYASLLPPDGHLIVTVPPNSVRASRLLTLDEPKGMVSEFEPFLQAVTSDNVAVVAGADLLSEHMLAGEYVYFRSDRHWTPYGAYLVTAKMLELAGYNLCPYDSFAKTQEHPFLGNIYRDSRNRQLESNPDTLDILTPANPVKVTRYSDRNTSREMPFIDWDADPRDRYTVYLGGPSGRLNVIEKTEKPEEGRCKTCLLITDSFGLCSVVYLLEVYDRVLLYDPRYYEPFAMGHISENAEAYGVQDVFFIADEGSFAGGTFFTLCNRQF